MKTVLVAEKPSVAMAVAQALGIRGEKQNGYIENDTFIVTWCVGHLVCMSYPEVYDEIYKVWNMEHLPFIPEKEKYMYEIIPEVRKQFETVKKIYNRNDVSKIIIYPDPAQEGFYLQELVLRQSGAHPRDGVYCAWVDSQTEEEIIKAYNECTPWTTKKYQDIIKAGYMRAKEDYLFGMNFSRALTLKYSPDVSERINSKATIAVGRVMSVVLGMVVQREREISDFEVTPYYRIQSTFKDVETEWKAVEGTRYFQSPEVYSDIGFLKKEKAEEFIAGLKKEISIEEIELKTEKRAAPLLFNLAELQSECTKRFKLSPAQTLSIAQELYENKLITYPRTDARVLTTAMAKVIGEYLEGIRNHSPIGKEYAEVILSEGSYKKLAFTKYVDDAKVSDHYAIIPTGIGFNQYSNLTEQEQMVYELILRRFLAIFYPNAEYKKVKLEAVTGNEHFFATSKQLNKEGYIEIYNYHKENEDKKSNLSELSQIKKGLVYPCEYTIIEGKTTPPKRYTSGSLILAMENAGQLIEDDELRETVISTGGIGTSATRAEIIEKLFRRKYLQLNPRTQIVSPEYVGELIFDVINNTIPGLLNPRLSASWTKGLKQIESGEITDVEYYDKLVKYISEEIRKIKEYDEGTKIRSDFYKTNNRYRDYINKMNIRERCPVCQKKLKVTQFGFCCENYGKEEGKCSFALSKSVSGKTLTDSQLRQLLTNKRLEMLKGFKTKDGKEFSAPLYLLSNGKLSFKPEDDIEIENLVCPICESNIEEEAYKWKCSKEGCSLEVPRMFGDKPLNRSHLKKLLKEGQTDLIKGFKGKESNKEFDAFLQFDSSFKLVYKFRQGEVDQTQYICPICKKPIVYVPFGLACKNYGKEEWNCKFALSSTISHKNLSDNVLLQLLKNGETKEISGFKNKDETKEYSASLYLKDDYTIGFRFREGYVDDCKCPKCKKAMVFTSFGLACENYGKEAGQCDFAISNTICKKKISDAALIQLIREGKTKELSGFKSKTGNSFSAVLYLKEDYSLAFELPTNKKETAIKCPKCNHNLVAGKYKIGCDRCKIQVPYVFAKKQLTAEHICSLIMKGRTDLISGFTSKNGKKFSARIRKNAKGEYEFEFEERKKLF